MPHCAKILFVDDDQAVLNALRRNLCRAYDTVMALGPESGLHLLEAEGPFAVVVSDLRMPGMNGVAFLKRAKALCPDIVGIMLTGHGDLTNAMAAVNEGHIFRFLTKPCPTSVLTQSLDAALAQYRMAAADRELLRVTLENAQLREDVERIMRHDLKTPLTAIIGLPQVMRDAGNLNEEQREMLTVIEDAGYTMLTMVNMSQAIFKMEHGRYVITPTEVDLVALARKILGVHADTASQRCLSFTITVDGQAATRDTTFLVRGEELLCYSMLANLVANAVEASPSGQTINLALRHDNGLAHLVIHNQGTVPDAIRDRFFEKYATAGKTHGTGLGTYSARLIARAHGGDIAMRTDEGLGTEITVDLPAA